MNDSVRGPTPRCPRCAEEVIAVAEVAGLSPEWQCEGHGVVSPMWRPDEATYDALVAQVQEARDVATYLPWPLAPGWSVTDLAVVGAPGDVRATMTGCSGASAMDGEVDLLVVLEDPGTGLGAARAGLPDGGPPASLFDVSPTTRVRAGDLDVRLWAVGVPEDHVEPVVPDSPEALFDPLAGAGPQRAVLVGEAAGRWLWVMVRPASALLLLTDSLILADAAGLGAGLVEVPFAGPPPRW